MKTAVLLIYETVPESTDLYLIPSECEFLDTLRACHQLFINCHESPELEKLSRIMYDNDLGRSLLEQWKLPKGHNPYTTGDLRITEIIVTGFFL